MFRITDIKTPRLRVEFGDGSAVGWGSNKVDLLVGANGSGKTELLTSLAATFREVGRSPKDVEVSWQRDGTIGRSNREDDRVRLAPLRVITETFSPFSRFAAPADDTLTLTDIYAEGDQRNDRYRSIGLHKRSRYIGGVLSRHTLEQGIFRLSEDPFQTTSMGSVLDLLGFKDRIKLTYRMAANMEVLLGAHRQGTLQQYLELVSSVEAPKAAGGRSSESAIRREVLASSVTKLTDLLAAALDLVGIQQDRNYFELSFSLRDGRSSHDYATLQSLALLRRLRLITLRGCDLTPKDGGRVDLANASSGQQQMLCSIFGLIAELRSDSLVLIDEPELSLHPTWQMSFLDRIRAVMRSFHGCHLLIATHSPLIVQSGLQLGLDVVRLGADQETSVSTEATVQSQRPPSVEGTLIDVFGTPVLGSVHLSNELFEIVADGTSGSDVDRAGALARLRGLEQTYSGDPGGRSMSLIRDAIDLVTGAGSSTESDEAEPADQ